MEKRNRIIMCSILTRTFVDTVIDVVEIFLRTFAKSHHKFLPLESTKTTNFSFYFSFCLFFSFTRKLVDPSSECNGFKYFIILCFRLVRTIFLYLAGYTLFASFLCSFIPLENTRSLIVLEKSVLRTSQGKKGRYVTLSRYLRSVILKPWDVERFKSWFCFFSIIFFFFFLYIFPSHFFLRIKIEKDSTYRMYPENNFEIWVLHRKACKRLVRVVYYLSELYSMLQSLLFRSIKFNAITYTLKFISDR